MVQWPDGKMIALVDAILMEADDDGQPLLFSSLVSNWGVFGEEIRCTPYLKIFTDPVESIRTEVYGFTLATGSWASHSPENASCSEVYNPGRIK